MKFSLRFDIQFAPPSVGELAERKRGIQMPLFLAFGVMMLSTLWMVVFVGHFYWADRTAAYVLLLAGCALAAQARPAERVFLSIRPIAGDDCVQLAAWRSNYPAVDRYVGQVFAQEREIVFGEFQMLQRYVAGQNELAKRNALYGLQNGS